MKMKKGYKQTEVGVIPEDWNDVKIVDVADIDPENLSSSTKPEYKFQYISLEDVDCGFLRNMTETVFEVAPSRARRKIKQNDILFGTVRPNLKSHYIVAEYVSDWVCSTGFTVIRCNTDETDPRYIYNHVFAYPINRQVDALIAGSNYPAVNSKDVKSLIIPLPPTKAEQTAIATALSDADALIQSLEKLIAKKRLIKQGAMQELLKPKEGWVVKKLGEVFSISGGYSASREQLSSEGFCYLHYGDIHGARKTFIDASKEYTDIPKLNIPLKKVSPKSLLNDGDVVFVDASEDDEGTSKHIVVKNPDGIPYISGLHTIVAKSKDESINDDYKRYCFQSVHIKSQFKFYAVGTKVSGISKTNITKIEIFLPALSDQKHIASILSDMDAEISTLETKLAKYKQLKQGMMQELLTGRIRLV